MKDSSFTEKTFIGMFWMFSGKGLQAVLQFIVTVVLARLLLPSDFGVVNVALVIISFTTIFSMVGVGPALIQRPTINEKHIQTGFTLTILLSISFTLLLFITSTKISSFFNMPELEKILKAMSIIFILKGLSTVSESLMQRKLRFKLNAIINFISYFVYGLVGVVTALLGAGYWALVIAHIVQSIVKTVLLIIYEKHNMIPKFDFESFKELFFFGSGYTLATITNHIAVQIDNLVVGKYLGSSALGLYGRAYQLMIMPTNLFGQVLDKVLFPAMARIQEDSNQLTKSFRIGTTAVALFAIPVGIMITLLSTEIVLIIFGDKWIDLVPVLQVLSIGLVFRIGYKLSDSLTKATGAVYRRTFIQIIYAIAVFLGSIAGLKWGVFGVSIGVLFAIVLNYILMTKISMRYINIGVIEIVKAHFPGMILGVFSLLSYLIMNWISVYIPLHYIVRIVIASGIFGIFIMIGIKTNAEKTFGKDVIWIKDRICQIIKR